MNKKYHYKIDFSKGSKKLAKSLSLHFNFWKHFYKFSKLKKVISYSSKELKSNFSSPKKFDENKFFSSNPLEYELKGKKFSFGNYQAVFKGKNLKNNFKKLNSILVSNKK